MDRDRGIPWEWIVTPVLMVVLMALALGDVPGLSYYALAIGLAIALVPLGTWWARRRKRHSLGGSAAAPGSARVSTGGAEPRSPQDPPRQG
ncbi:hypothetical protein ACQ3I4_09040 [Zafaria sp. Z1313]|uniref:hypothetical protein n=1 Tax=unclassified Zafaria TaxID=2828765 RepID=UPI002E78A9C7|nr:hypothetical protein [Zafaria sp. J156]MEE1621651.1 hypothetical protein [Zafaria sp. J156]